MVEFNISIAIATKTGGMKEKITLIKTKIAKIGIYETKVVKTMGKEIAKTLFFSMLQEAL